MEPQDVSENVYYNYRAVVTHLVPPREEIPNEFFKNNNTWSQFVSTLFFEGGSFADLIEHKGIDRKKALRHINTVLQNMALEHNYKIAAAAFLLSSWFDHPELWTHPHLKVGASRSTQGTPHVTMRRLCPSPD